MKNSLILLTCLVACSLLYGFEQKNQAQVTQSKNAESSKQSANSPLPAADKDSADKNEGKGRPAANETRSEEVTIISAPKPEHFIDWGMLICTAILALAGIAGTGVAIYAACVAVKTLRAIETEARSAVTALEHSASLADAAQKTATTALQIAEATGKSAAAALINAQAVINSERPWIVITVIPHPSIEGTFIFKATNKGRTPAQFVSGTHDHTFAFKADDLSTTPDYASVFNRPNEDLVMQGESFDVSVVRPESIAKSRGMEDQIFNGNQTLFFYGRIVYDDVFGKRDLGYVSHETCWCYACFENGKRFITTGPDEYNKHT